MLCSDRYIVARLCSDRYIWQKGGGEVAEDESERRVRNAIIKRRIAEGMTARRQLEFVIDDN